MTLTELRKSLGQLLQDPIGGKMSGKLTQALLLVASYAEQLDGNGGAGVSQQDIEDYAEPKFTKNSAFNKNFGNGNEEAARGDHTHNQYLEEVNNGDWNGADLEIDNGGTGAYSASAARANLGLEIDVDVARQNHDHDAEYAPIEHTHGGVIDAVGNVQLGAGKGVYVDGKKVLGDQVASLPELTDDFAAVGDSATKAALLVLRDQLNELTARGVLSGYIAQHVGP